MTSTIARIKKAGKTFEVMVDMDQALQFKKTGSPNTFLETERIFYDVKKGNVASSADLTSSFGTTDVQSIGEIIAKQGEILINQEHRDEEKERRYKQVVDFLVKHACDPKTGLPHTTERIKNALDQAHVNIKNTSIESQIGDILGELSKLIPIKIVTKKVKITIPAIHTGKAYGIVAQYKQTENWLNDGSLEVIALIPAGMILDFYDKLNSVTHGSVLTEEIKE